MSDTATQPAAQSDATPGPLRAGGASPIRRLFRGLLIGLFLVSLVAPTFDLLFKLDPNPLPLRTHVAFPEISFDRSILALPGKLQWYVESTMGFRGTLVRLHGLFKLDALDVSPSPTSDIVVSPWFFKINERVLDDFRRVDPFTESQLRRWRTVLEERRDWLARRNARFIFVVAPNKETVYAEIMPAWITRLDRPSRLDQLVDYMRKNSDVVVVDLRPALLSHKAEGRLYHHTDTHWNDLGAFYGYRAIADRLHESFPAIRPLQRESFELRETLVTGGDMARAAGLKRDRLEPLMQLINSGLAAHMAGGGPLIFDRMDVAYKDDFVTQCPRGEIASAVILRDSFGELLLPYLAEHFQTAAWSWTLDFPVSMIESNHPAVVIQEVVERRLMSVNPDEFPAIP